MSNPTCPFCGADVKQNCYIMIFKCGTWAYAKNPNRDCQTELCAQAERDRMAKELAAAKDHIRRLEEALEFGVGPTRAKELLEKDHIGEAAGMVEETNEVPCPDCYGGHFKPCNFCGDSGVALVKTKAKEAKP